MEIRAASHVPDPLFAENKHRGDRFKLAWIAGFRGLNGFALGMPVSSRTLPPVETGPLPSRTHGYDGCTLPGCFREEEKLRP